MLNYDNILLVKERDVNMEDEILNDIKTIMNVEIESIKDLKRFNQGMSNYTFKFTIKNEAYVYRKIGLDADLFVNYYDEYENLTAAYNQGVTSEIIYFNKETGTKIQKYIEGETFDFDKFDNVGKNLIETLKKLHSVKDQNLKPYGLIERLNKYESYLDDKLISDYYFQLKQYFIKTYNESFINNPLVFCHNDLQSINIINNNSKIYLIDFEYGSLNDIFFDFATFEENSTLVFESYYNREITKLELAKINFYKIFSSLQWYLVATYKELVGFSKLTNYDFNELANYFINKALSLYEKIKEVNFSEIS